MHLRIAVLVVGFALAAADARAQTAADTGHKSAVLAGVASFFLPGVGSWYAGDDHHARVHGGIALGLGVAGTIVDAVADCFELSCKEDVANAAVGLIVIGALTNLIWSSVTAVHDANAYNERAERLRTGRIEIAPALRLAAPPAAPERWRVEMRVLRVEF